MNNIFSDLLDVCIMIYLDDILIYSNDMSKHHWYVKKVLKCLHKTGLYAKAEKCEFHSELVEYLEYILSPSSLTMSYDKVKIIQDYSDIVIPLTCLTWKDILWKFDSFCRDAFNSLKKAFTSASILTHWIPDAQLIMETDALDYALTIILSIVNKENEVHSVTFHSHTFTVAELNYNTHDKELLAIFEAFKIWQHYLEGPAYSINIVMDHKNLEYFSTTQWDIYPKKRNTSYATVNLHNFKPIFTQEQLVAYIRAIVLLFSSLHIATVMDLDILH